MRTHLRTALLAILATAGTLMASPAIASADMPVYENLNTGPAPSDIAQLFGSSTGFSSGSADSFATIDWVKAQYASGQPVYEVVGVEASCNSHAPGEKNQSGAIGCGLTTQLPKPIEHWGTVYATRNVPAYHAHYKKVTTIEQLNSPTPKYVVMSLGPTEPLPNDFWTQANRPVERVSIYSDRVDAKQDESPEAAALNPFDNFYFHHHSPDVGTVLGGSFDQPGATGIFLVRPALFESDKLLTQYLGNLTAFRRNFDAYGRNWY